MRAVIVAMVGLLMGVGCCARALTVGETLSYVVQFAGIPAGEQTLTVSEKMLPGQERVYILSSRTASVGLITLLISVDDEIETHVDPETLLPVYVRMKYHENNRRDNWEVTIEENDEDGSVMAVVRDLEDDTVREEVLPRRPMDILSLVYWAREQELSVGQTYEVLLLDPSDATFRDIVFRVARRDDAYTYMGQFPALVCYQEGQEGGISVWLSDDERRLPLYTEVETPAGTLAAVLKSAYPEVRTTVP
jgi:hypothetical protein